MANSTSKPTAAGKAAHTPNPSKPSKKQSAEPHKSNKAAVPTGKNVGRPSSPGADLVAQTPPPSGGSKDQSGTGGTGGGIYPVL